MEIIEKYQKIFEIWLTFTSAIKYKGVRRPQAVQQKPVRFGIMEDHFAKSEVYGSQTAELDPFQKFEIFNVKFLRK